MRAAATPGEWRQRHVLRSAKRAVACLASPHVMPLARFKRERGADVEELFAVNPETRLCVPQEPWDGAAVHAEGAAHPL